MLARLAGALRMLGMAIAFVIAVGVALVALEAREEGIVAAWLDACRFLTDPFRGIVDLERGREHLQIGINWGIAAAVYLVAASLLARLLVRARLGTARARRRHGSRPAT